MSDTTSTPEEKVKLRELAAKATPGPWANTDTVFELFGAYPDDWWKIYAKKPEGMRGIPYLIVCGMSCRATDEEMAEARRVSWSDHTKPYDLGQAGNDARYIAAACNMAPRLLTALAQRDKAAKYAGQCVATALDKASAAESMRAKVAEAQSKLAGAEIRAEQAEAENERLRRGKPYVAAMIQWAGPITPPTEQK